MTWMRHLPHDPIARHLRRAGAHGWLLCLALLALPAAALERPAGPVILTVSGNILHTNAPGAAEFDLAMLRELGGRSFRTATIWTEGVSLYEGVLLQSVLDTVGAEGDTVTATALNDYSVSFPMAEVGEKAPILAYLRDGAPMSVRDKGPLWVIYPYDDDAAYRTEQVFSRSVWQLNRLRIED